MHLRLASLALVFLIPFSASAGVTDVFSAESLVIDLLTRLNYLFMIMAIVFFFWGIVKFISNADDSAEHEQGKSFMVWGVISFVVLFSLWAIVRFVLTDTLGLPGTATIDYVDRNNAVVSP